MTELTILNPTGHLGFTPFDSESFQRGVAAEPDVICADSGSADIGPNPLGSNESASPARWQKRDLEEMLLAARELDVPMIVGSAADTGTDAGVDRYVRFLREIADENDLEPFSLARIYSEVPEVLLLDRLDGGAAIEGLGDRSDLTSQVVEDTDTIVAVMGTAPYLDALERGADVIVAGRSTDVAVFAAPAIHAGVDPATAYFGGKIIECAGLAAEPKGARKSVLGTFTDDALTVEPTSDEQAATPASVASHALYERSSPFVERFPGGHVDMADCAYEAIDEQRTRVTGATFVEDDAYRVKLEGSGVVGERRFMMVGIRDPTLIERLDDTLAWSRQTVADRVDSAYELHYHVYGRDGVMGDLEPESGVTSHELGVLVEGVAPQADIAEEVAQLAGRNLMYVEFPDGTPTWGSHLASFVSDEVWRAEPVCEWTINHLMELDDPLELHDVELLSVGAT